MGWPVGTGEVCGRAGVARLLSLFGASATWAGMVPSALLVNRGGPAGEAEDVGRGASCVFTGVSLGESTGGVGGGDGRSVGVLGRASGGREEDLAGRAFSFPLVDLTMGCWFSHSSLCSLL